MKFYYQGAILSILVLGVLCNYAHGKGTKKHPNGQSTTTSGPEAVSTETKVTKKEILVDGNESTTTKKPHVKLSSSTLFPSRDKIEEKDRHALDKLREQAEAERDLLVKLREAFGFWKAWIEAHGNHTLSYNTVFETLRTITNYMNQIHDYHARTQSNVARIPTPTWKTK